MKLKLSQLKQIIKEEVTNAMNEGPEWVVQGPADSLSQAESKLIAALKPLNAALEIDGFRASELYSKVDDAAATIAFVLEEIEKMKRP
jgi:hypothetical protein